MSETLKHIKAVEVGLKCEEKTTFCQYEIWVDFDDGHSDVETVNPEDILQRVNDWNFCKHVGGALGKSRIEASSLGLRFTWPDSFGIDDNPQKVLDFQVYYYDVYGVKHYTTLVRFS